LDSGNPSSVSWFRAFFAPAAAALHDRRDDEVAVDEVERILI
jgi:hypothetical protein